LVKGCAQVRILDRPSLNHIDFSAKDVLQAEFEFEVPVKESLISFEFDEYGTDSSIWTDIGLWKLTCWNGVARGMKSPAAKVPTRGHPLIEKGPDTPGGYSWARCPCYRLILCGRHVKMILTSVDPADIIGPR
jgi:hypothetical protein